MRRNYTPPYRSLYGEALAPLRAAFAYPGESAERGRARIERFSITRQEANLFNIRAGRRSVKPGDYARLFCGRALWMSDTQAEFWDHLELFRQARGRVLMHGLGLGCATRVILSLPEVEHVEVWEIEPDVAALVGDPLAAQFGDRIRVRLGDAKEHRPAKGERWDVVWHDIWSDICEDNLPEIRAMKRRFARRCDWQGAWAEEECRRG